MAVLFTEIAVRVNPDSDFLIALEMIFVIVFCNLLGNDISPLFLTSRCGRLIACLCGIACQVVVRGFVHALLALLLVAVMSAVGAEG